MLPLSALASEAPNANMTRYCVLVLDTSGSMSGTPCMVQQDAALKFCESLFSAPGNNYVALVRMNSGASVLSEFSNDLEELREQIERTGANGGTNFYDAFSRADELLQSVSDVPYAVRNLVFSSDGLPESGPTSDNGPYDGSWNSDYKYANAALELVPQLLESYYVYTLGFFHRLSDNEKRCSGQGSVRI